MRLEIHSALIQRCRRDRCDLSPGRRIQSILTPADRHPRGVPPWTGKYSVKNIATLLATDFDRAKLARWFRPHEGLDQLVSTC